jgi:hypothetical protein
MKSILALFVTLAIILAIKPRMINNAYNTIVGRLVLICIVIFFSMNNATLGLLVVLLLIVVINKYGVNQYGNIFEGLENINTPGTVGEDNVAPPTGADVKQVLTKSETTKNQTLSVSELKAKADKDGAEQVGGVDKEDIKNALASKPSNSIPVDKNVVGSSDNTMPSTQGTLNGGVSLTESFSSMCASAY